MSDPFQTQRTLSTSQGDFSYSSLPALEASGIGTLHRLPYSIRVLLESALRNTDGYIVEESHVKALATWSAESAGQIEILKTHRTRFGSTFHEAYSIVVWRRA